MALVMLIQVWLKLPRQAANMRPTHPVRPPPKPDPRSPRTSKCVLSAVLIAIEILSVESHICSSLDTLGDSFTMTEKNDSFVNIDEKPTEVPNIGAITLTAEQFSQLLGSLNLGSTQPAGKVETTHQPDDHERFATLQSGMEVRSTPRSDAELLAGKVLLRCDERGDDPVKRQKLLEKNCASLKSKLQTPDVAGIVTGGGEVDLGISTAGLSAALREFYDWTNQVDVAYVLKMPVININDYEDHYMVARASRWIDLRKDWKEPPLLIWMLALLKRNTSPRTMNSPVMTPTTLTLTPCLHSVSLLWVI